jgi:hypothetical protein
MISGRWTAIVEVTETGHPDSASPLARSPLSALATPNSLARCTTTDVGSLFSLRSDDLTSGEGLDGQLYEIAPRTDITHPRNGCLPS